MMQMVICKLSGIDHPWTVNISWVTALMLPEIGIAMSELTE